MDAILHHQEEKHKRRSLIASIAIHIALFLLFLLPFFHFPIPPPGQQGILVSLGIPDQGDGSEMAKSSADEAVEPEEKAEASAQPKPEVAEQQARSAAKEVILDSKSKTNPIAEAEKKNPTEAELEKQRQARLAEERKKAEEAKRKAAEEEAARKKAEYEKTKNAYGDLFGTGDGKGNTGKQGNQGNPDGDPNAKALEGISTGSGMVGGGLGDRGVLYEPKITDNSQKVGRVVVRVCVGPDGNVSEAEYTQKGSTTTDAELRDLAERSARQFRFTPSKLDKQCGTITIEFRVR